MMTAPAAIRATFSDFKLLKGRKIAQLICEVPIEEANAALNTLGGVPQPADPVWIAIARLTDPAHSASDDAGAGAPPKPATASLKRKWEDMLPSQQAGIRCNERSFWRFLHEKRSVSSVLASNSNEAAEQLRSYLQVNSRLELDNWPSSSFWHVLDADYRAWLREPEHV